LCIRSTAIDVRRHRPVLKVGKAATMLGLTIPPSLPGRADEVVQ